MYLKEKPKDIGLRWLLIICWDTLCMFGVVLLVFSNISDWIIGLIVFIISFVSISLLLWLNKHKNINPAT